MKQGKVLSGLFRRKPVEPEVEQPPALAVVTQDGYGRWIGAIEVSYRKNRALPSIHYIYKNGKYHTYSYSDHGFRFENEDQARRMAKAEADKYNAEWKHKKDEETRTGWTVVDDTV